MTCVLGIIEQNAVVMACDHGYEHLGIIRIGAPKIFCRENFLLGFSGAELSSNEQRNIPSKLTTKLSHPLKMDELINLDHEVQNFLGSFMPGTANNSWLLAYKGYLFQTTGYGYCLKQSPQIDAIGHNPNLFLDCFLEQKDSDSITNRIIRSFDHLMKKDFRIKTINSGPSILFLENENTNI